MFNKKAVTMSFSLIISLIIMGLILWFVFGGLGAKNIEIIKNMDSCETQGGYCIDKELLIVKNKCIGEDSTMIRYAFCEKEEVCCSGENPYESEEFGDNADNGDNGEDVT
jgi:hypothetical protein